MSKCIVNHCEHEVEPGLVMCDPCRYHYVVKAFTASAAETSAAGTAQLPESPALQPGVVGGSNSPAADALSDEQRQTAEYMAEVLRTVKRKTKRLINQVPQRFHGELFDLAITAARAAAKWDYVNQPAGGDQ